jgi:RND family efflux transporter MFP subunit
MRRWVTIVVLLLCLALVFPVACAGGTESEVRQQLTEVVRGDLAVTVSGSGNVEVSNEARLAFGSGGKVDRIYVEEGDAVLEGDVLAELVTGPLDLALIQAEVALETAEYNLSQAQEVYTKPDIDTARLAVDEARKFLDFAEEELEQAFSAKERSKWAFEVDRAERLLARAIQRRDTLLDTGDTEEVVLKKLEVEAARKALAEAHRQLDEATITAPFDGIVASVEAKEKDVIPPPTLAASTIIRLIDPGSMELEAEVDEIDIPLVKPDQKAIIEVDALPALGLEGRIVSIQPLPIEEAGVVLFKVKIELDVPEDSGLRVGMSAEADIVIAGRSNVLLVPSRAIQQDSQGNPVVTVMVGEQTEERSVVIGISDDLQTEILDGLSEGETVVLETRVKASS